ncbi:MAG TPA: HD domain-containing phosphohydrolase [Thermoleophilaceae bacterium]
MNSWRGTSVLVVEDDEPTRELLRGALEEGGHSCTMVADAEEARGLLDGSPFALALCDVMTSGESGIDLAGHIVREHHDTAVVIVSSQDDVNTAQTALELGAFGYVLKPFHPKELLLAVTAALRRRDAEVEGRIRRQSLEKRLELQSAALRERVNSVEEQSSADDTLLRLSRAIQLRSHETGEHLDRVGRYSALLARELCLGDDYSNEIRRASALHDIGKVAISDDVLLKPGPLTTDERREIERHPAIGEEVLAGSHDPVLALAASIAASHHEWHDGNGYPQRLAGDDIPLEGRIVAIGDAFDALTHDRVYRRAFPVPLAISMMAQERGSHFDPELLDVFLDVADEATAIQARAVKERAPSPFFQGARRL